MPRHKKTRQQSSKKLHSSRPIEEETGGQNLDKNEANSRKRWVLITVSFITVTAAVYVLILILGFSSTIANAIAGFFLFLGVLFSFLQWASPLPGSKQESRSTEINPSITFFLKRAWQNRKVKAGTILIVLFLTAGPLIYASQIRSQHPAHFNLALIPFPPGYQGALVLNDTMKSQANDSNWNIDSNCFFTGDAYHIHVAGSDIHPCFVQNANFGDFVFQVEMVIVQADDSFGGGGIVFRADSGHSRYYGFFITKAGDGELFISSGNENWLILKKDSVNGLQTSQNQINLIAVVAKGDHIQVFVNKILFADVNDDTYSQGQIGLFALGPQYSDVLSTPSQTEVAFISAKLWRL